MGSWSSAPTSRASRTCRPQRSRASGRRPTPRWRPPGPASPSGVFFRGDVRAGEGATACRNAAPRRPVLGDQQRQAVQDQSTGRGGSRHGAAGRAGRPGRPRAGRRPRPTPGEQRRQPGAQIGLARQLEVERLEPLGRLEQQRRGVAAQARGERDLPAQQVHPGALRTRPAARPPPWPAVRRALSNAPACRLARAAASARSARRSGSARQHHRALEERRGRGQAAAGLRPAGRALEFGRDLLVRPGRGLGPVPGPPVRVRHRIGHLRQRAVHLPAGPGPTPTGRPPSAPADAGTAPARRTPTSPASAAGARRLSADPQPLGRPPHQRPGHRTDRPPPAAAAAGSARAGRRAAAGSSPRSGPPAAPRPAARTRPPAPPASARAAARAAPAGCPASRRRSGRGPAHPAARPAPSPAAPARRRRRSPSTASSGSPASSAPGTRAAKTSPTGRPPAGGPRSRAPAPRPGPATARRRSRRPAAAPRPPPRAG